MILTLLKNIIKPILPYIIIALLAGTIFLQRNEIKGLREDYGIMYGNLKSALDSNSIREGRVQNLTQSQFKYLYHKIDSVGNKIGIKTRNISDITQFTYHYKDTTITKAQTVIVGDSINFIAFKDCGVVGGTVYPDKSVSVNLEGLNDNLTTFTYRSDKKIKLSFKKLENYDAKFWFVYWMSHKDTKIYSECKQDTIAVNRNIHIIDNN